MNAAAVYHFPSAEVITTHLHKYELLVQPWHIDGKVIAVAAPLFADLKISSTEFDQKITENFKEREIILSALKDGLIACARLTELRRNSLSKIEPSQMN